jgi:hypothetical protein
MCRIVTMTYENDLHITQPFDNAVEAQKELDRRRDAGVAAYGRVELKTPVGWIPWEPVWARYCEA